jgi:hypothetical protein
MQRTSSRPNKTISKGKTHAVLSGRKLPRHTYLGAFDSIGEAEKAGFFDSAGPVAMGQERGNTRAGLGLIPSADYKHVQTAQNRLEFGNVVTKGEPPGEKRIRLAREASFNNAQAQNRPSRKTWYKPSTWLNGGNKSNTKKRKSRKHKTRKHKTRKHKTRKHKKYKQKRK